MAHHRTGESDRRATRRVWRHRGRECYGAPSTEESAVIASDGGRGAVESQAEAAVNGKVARVHRRG